METTQFTTTVIKADNGKFLTQSGDIDIKERVISTTIALGKNDSVLNWREISATEAESYRKEKKAALKDNHPE